MKRVFYINDTLENRITYYHLLLFSIAYPFDRFYTILILISFAIHTAIFFSKKKISKINSSKGIFFYALFFSFFALSSKSKNFEARKEKSATRKSDPRIILKKSLQEI
jgi:hypothetical protein